MWIYLLIHVYIDNTDKMIHVYTILYHFGIFTMMTDKLIRSDKPQAVGEDFATQYQAKCIDMY